jgi:hypothetical protein
MYWKLRMTAVTFLYHHVSLWQEGTSRQKSHLHSWNQRWSLFCLANLSESLIVVTRTKTIDSLGQWLRLREFQPAESRHHDTRKGGNDHDGCKLFHALPVRRTGLTKRIKARNEPRLSKWFKNVRSCLVLCLLFVMITHSPFKDDILCLRVPFNLIDVVEQGSSDGQKSSFPRQMHLPKSGADGFCWE